MVQLRLETGRGARHCCELCGQTEREQVTTNGSWWLLETISFVINLHDTLSYRLLIAALYIEGICLQSVLFSILSWLSVTVDDPIIAAGLSLQGRKEICI